MTSAASARAPRRAAALLLALGLILPLTVVTTAPAAAATVGGAADLRADNAATPFGIDRDGPSFSWKLTSTARGAAQTAYQIRVAPTSSALAGAPVWDSGRVASDQSTFVAYDGPSLESQTRYQWQVRTWDHAGAESAWSEPTWFETAIFDPSEWEADWIAGPDSASRLDAWTDYRASIDFTLVPGTAFGVFLRASDTNNALMWQVNDETPGVPKLRPHTRVGGGYALLGEVDLRAAGLAADVLTRPATIRIETRGATIATSINGVLVDTRDVEVPRFAKGLVGFRTSQSTTALESVLIRSVDVAAEDGTTLLDTTFDGATNPFTGGALTDDGLQLTGNNEVLVALRDQQPLLRTEFDTGERTIVGARVYATARGVYELSLNGEKVGDQHLAPGWTDYGTRIEYQTYDVTALLQDGRNAFGAMIAPGWYAGRLAHIGAKNYGTDPSLLAQLRIDYADGGHDLIVTDDSWSTAPGPYALADLIEGEDYLAEFEHDGWQEPGYDDAGWAGVRTPTASTAALVAQTAPPVRTTEERPALARTEPTPGAHVYDLGQNMVGVVRAQLRGEAGSTVRVRYGEELNPDGTLYTANLRSARATDYYTFDETGEIAYEPRFTFHGFRYVEITGVASPPSTDELTGLVWGSDLDPIGQFQTSDALINQLQSNITWGQRGNFLSIPTDTPARDERMGWSGDINVFAPTASFNMDSLSFLSKWLVDLQDAQQPNGDYHGVAPYHPNLACCGGGTGWSDAGITVPWVLWQSYGDTRQIREGWASMTAYLAFLQRSYPSHVRGSSYADWLHLDDPTPGDVLGTAYYAYVAGLMSQMAEAIGESADAARYASLADEVTAVFRERFIAADGTISGDSQAGYAIAIGMGLVPDDAMPAVAAKFVATLERRDFHLSTGFLGTPWLVSSLAESGNLDVAYRVLLNKTYPSWGYEIENGATTLWERWNSILPDGSFGDVSMNSFNHYAYGAVGDWMYRSIGGIASASPGYRHAVVDPQIGGGLTHAEASFDSVYGTFRTAWRTSGGDYDLRVTVPANATATVVLPVGHPLAATESGQPLAEVDGVGEIAVDGDTLRVEVAAGSYAFAVDGDAHALAGLVEAIDTARADVDDPRDAGEIPADAHGIAVEAFESASDRAVAALAGETDAESALADILAALDGADARLADIDEVEGARAAVRDVLVATGVATSRIIGVGVTLSPDLPAIPGGSFAAEVAVDNGSGTAITALASAVTAPPTWRVSPATVELARLGDGDTDRRTYRVTVDADADTGDTADLAALTRFTRGEHRLVVASGVSVGLESPLTVGEVSAAPQPVSPGDTLTLTVPVTNTSATALAVRAEAALPAAWHGPARSAERIVEPGETAQLTLAAVVPPSVTARPLDVAVSILRAGAVVATGAARAVVALDPVQYDAVDLGDAASENAHALTAHPSSGTSTEAGLTRRYSHGGVPGSWFEFDVAVPAGAPFTVRLVETYGSAGTKDYSVLANGVTVFERTHTSAPGTAEATFTVDDPAISASGTVRLRFQRGDDALGDPSIANVWVYDTAVTDHVDLGFSYSETRHALTAAPSSATSVEAGYTRRYSGVQVPGSWFEFDLAVPADGPFLLRLRETYDGPQNKEYAVFVDGVLVEDRAVPRPESGSGVVDYQILVDDPRIERDGTVRVRLQKSQTGPERHDPSIADAWAVGAPADTVAPVPSMTVASPAESAAGWHRAPATVTLHAQDDRDLRPGIEYRIGDGAWQDYVRPFTIEADGVHEVAYRATDAAGNTSADAAGTVRVDTEGPIATVVASPGPVSGDWYGAGTLVTASATDALSGVASIEVRTGGEWLPYDGSITIPHGTVDVEVRARDVAGNLGETFVLPVRVDAIAPEATASVTGVEGENGWIVADARVRIDADDADSGVASIEYRTDGGWQGYRAPIVVPAGVSTVEYRATDTAGNVSAVGSIQVRVDGASPTVAWAVDAERVLTLVADDDVSGVATLEYALGDGGWQPYTAPVTVGTQPQAIRVRASDNAGRTAEADGILVGGRLSTGVVSPGDRVVVTGAGYAPGERVRIELRSTPVVLATVVADADGQIEAVVTIPADTAQGQHAIVLFGDGSEVRLAILVHALAATGLAIAPYALAGIGVAALAAGLLFVRRRRLT